MNLSSLGMRLSKKYKSHTLIAFLVFALVMQLIGSVFYFDVFADVPIGKFIYLLTKAMLVLLPVVFWLFYKKEIKGFYKSVPQTKKSLFLGLLAGIFAFVVIYIFYWLSPELVASSSEGVKEKVYELKIESFFIPFAIFVSIAHSLLEEFYWRWFVFRGLRMNINYKLAAVISSLGFASHHFIILKEMFPLWATVLFGCAVGFGGYVWCEIYERTGSLKGAWLAHAMADMAIMSLGYLMIT